MKGTTAATPSNLPTTPQNNFIQGPGGYSSTSQSLATMGNLSVQQPPPVQPQFVPGQHYGQAQQPIAGFQDLSQQHQPVPNQYAQTPQPSGSGTSIHLTPATGQSSTRGLPPLAATAYQLDDFVDIDDVPSSQAPLQETVSPSELAKGKRRATDNVDDERRADRPKRNRKPTAKAAALRFLDIEAADEADEGEIDVSEIDDDGEY